MEGGCDGRLMGQTGILALDGVRMLVGVAAVVVATSVPGIVENPLKTNSVIKENPMLTPQR